MSITDTLRADVTRVQDDLARMRREAATLSDRILAETRTLEHLRATLSYYAQHEAPAVTVVDAIAEDLAAPEPAPEPAKGHEPRLTEQLMAVIREAGEPLSVTDIKRRAASAGVPLPAAPGLVGSILVRSRRFLEVSPGLWGVVEAV